MEWNYVYGLGQRLARYNGGTKQIYHNDHLGNVRALTNSNGAAVGTEDYYPYGNQLAISGSPGKYTYNSKEYMDDWGFNLYYYGARFMDPVTGRFMTPDPIEGSLNPYSYVGNNPVNRIDPTGMIGGPVQTFSVLGPHGFGDFSWAVAALNAMTLAENRLIEYSEKKTREQKVKDLIADMKDKCQALADHMYGPFTEEHPNKWLVIIDYMDRLAKSYDPVSNSFGLCKFENKVMALDENGEEKEVEATMGRSGVMTLASRLFAGANSDEYLEHTMIHEFSHIFYGDAEAFSYETEMEYYNAYPAATINNTDDIRWNEIYVNWKDQHDLYGARYDPVTFWDIYIRR